jgi:S1-C subfamily serine protease
LAPVVADRRSPARQVRPAAAHGLLIVAMAMCSAVMTAAQPQCQAEEGTELASAFGLRLCRGTTSIAPVTHVEPQRGARVVAVDGAASEAGLRAGDVIYQVDGQRVESGEAVENVLSRHREPAALLNIWRGAHPYLVRLWPMR